MRLARTFRSPRESKDSASTLSGRSLSVVVAMAMAGVLVGIVAAPSAAVAAATPTLGIHDGSINVCDHRELRTGLPAKKGAAGGSQRSQPDYAGVRTAMDSPYWAALNVRTIRFSPPWDVADPSLVHSGHSSAEASSTNPKKLFGDDPVLAAKMWVAVNGACSGACTVIAGDFGPYTQFDGGQSPYLTTYAKNLNGLRPAVWGEHPYSTIGAAEHSYEHGQAPPDPVHTVVGRFADALRHVGYGSHTQIWLNEISANDPGGVNGQAVQAKAGNYLLTELIQAGGRTIPREGLEPVVTAIYYLDYTFNSRAALVYGAQEPPRLGGKPRMIYCVFVQRAGNPNSGCKPALQQRGARPQPPRARRPRPHRPSPRRTPHAAWHAPSGHPPPGHAPPGHAPPGHAPPGHPPPGHPPPGHAPHATRSTPPS